MYIFWYKRKTKYYDLQYHMVCWLSLIITFFFNFYFVESFQYSISTQTIPQYTWAYMTFNVATRNKIFFLSFNSLVMKTIWWKIQVKHLLFCVETLNQLRYWLLCVFSCLFIWCSLTVIVNNFYNHDKISISSCIVSLIPFNIFMFFGIFHKKIQTHT